MSLENTARDGIRTAVQGRARAEDLEKPVAVVTGAAGALGQATAKAFREEGYRLVLVDRIATLGSRTSTDTIVGIAELGDRDALAGIRDEVGERFGRVDALCNVAGGFAVGGPVHQLEMTVWREMMAANVESVLSAAATFAPSLIESRGAVVNVAALGGLRGRSAVSAYSASKSAVMRLTESMSEELAASGVRVNAVLPGTIDTKANRDAMPGVDRSTWVSTDAIAEVILFLCTHRARAITGALVPVGR